MAERDELGKLWGARPRRWMARYLRSLDPNVRKDAKAQLRHVDHMFTEARASGNPLWVWMAYRNFRDHDLPLPEWLLEYFDAVEQRFQAIVEAQPKRACPAVAEALFMNWRGRGNAFTTLRNPEEFVATIEMIQSRLRGESRSAAVARAAQKLGVDKRTARRHRNAILKRAREPHAG